MSRMLSPGRARHGAASSVAALSATAGATTFTNTGGTRHAHGRRGHVGSLRPPAEEAPPQA